MRARSIATITAISSGVWAWSSQARADFGQSIVAGYIFTAGSGNSPRAAHGFEISHVLRPWARDKKNDGWFFGGLAQGQIHTDGSVRAAFAVETGIWVFGVEAGIAHRTGVSGYASTTGLHLAPIFTLGFLTLGVRFTVPFVAREHGYGNEAGFHLAIKWPLYWDKATQDSVIPEIGWYRMGKSGRVLRDKSGEPIECEVTRKQGANEDDCVLRDSIAIEALSASEREALAAAWAKDGREEYSAIVAFERLESELRSLGAADALIERARGAARDERGHAQACFAIASAYAGESIEPLRRSLQFGGKVVREVDRVVVAIESLLDGWVNEGVSAAIARHGARRASDGAVANVLRTIARDEARHARLGREVFEWSVRLLSDRERYVVFEALERALKGRVDVGGEEGLAAFGRVSASEREAIYRATVERVARCVFGASRQSADRGRGDGLRRPPERPISAVADRALVAREGARQEGVDVGVGFGDR